MEQENNEMRKDKRAPFYSRLSVDKIYRIGDEETQALSAALTITNISRSGIGLLSSLEMPLGDFFTCKISLDQERTFEVVIKVVRVQQIGENYQIGGEFTCLCSVFKYYIEDYVQEIEELT
jgi:hypothetical protein